MFSLHDLRVTALFTRSRRPTFANYPQIIIIIIIIIILTLYFNRVTRIAKRNFYLGLQTTKEKIDKP